MTELLQIQGMSCGYNGSTVLSNVDLTVAAGQVVAVLGGNRAGKTTLLHAVIGLVRTHAGTIILNGIDITRTLTWRIARHGVAIVPQQRRPFASLTVAEHLALAQPAHRRRSRPPAWTRARVLQLLPPLRARLNHRAQQLSGGEAQLLAVAQALLRQPKLVLLDEPSQGLAPALLTTLTDVIADLADGGVGIVLAEQNLSVVTAVAHHAIDVEHGRVVGLDHARSPGTA